jgi:hypothetical protein
MWLRSTMSATITILRLAQTIGQLESVDVKRLRQLEQKNAKLKRLLAEHDLKINLMKEVAAKLQTWRARRCVSGRSFGRSCVNAGLSQVVSTHGATLSQIRLRPGVRL